MIAMLVLAGCPGSLITPLPPGSGPGVYAGRFLNDDEQDLGAFSLTIDATGAASGTGLLAGSSVELTGTLTGVELDGLITDTVTQLSGRFDGALVGPVLAGDFRLPQTAGADELSGLWDAAPQS